MKFLKVMYFIPLHVMPRVLQGRRIKIMFATCFHSGFLLALYLYPVYGRCNFPPKRRLTFNGIHAVVFQNIELFVTTAV
jgi:hypothetical protein